jgi:hypothetical protein
MAGSTVVADSDGRTSDSNPLTSTTRPPRSTTVQGAGLASYTLPKYARTLGRGLDRWAEAIADPFRKIKPSPPRKQKPGPRTLRFANLEIARVNNTTW